MRGRRHKLQVSTFPFLAVLLCAMGSLILVLLVMDRKAHKAAQARAQREAARLVDESARNESARQAEREHLKQQALKEWEQKGDALHEKLTREQVELQLQMRKVREELQGIAARLHYEQDTTTQLRHKAQDERSRLQAEEQLLRTLRPNATQTENQSKESSQALQRMTLDLLQMEQVLKDLKAARQREQKTFSVVPYHGRRGENRRPLYVECTADGVIFHPERKAMSVAALLPGSGDPSSDVRAEVERRIAQQRQKLAALPNNVDKTPYLLLLLRPSGVTTYHLFQRALRGLPLDFGYEFIDEDWVLDFPADDELPSTQPWMIATKTPSRPALAPSVAAALPPPTSPRPMGGAPRSNPVEVSTHSIRGFRAGEAGTIGGSLSGGRKPPETGRTQGAYAPRSDNNAGFSGSQTEVRNAGSVGSGSSSGGTGLSRGNGHGHPSAMPPPFPSDEGGMGFSGDGSASGGGYRGTGAAFRLGGSNSGPGPGSGLPMDGLPGGPGSDLPGLGPPRALASGPGEGYAGGGTAPSGIAGTGSTGNGNGVPGNGWAGGGTGIPGVPGSAPGMGTSADGRYVIARGNNGGDALGPTFNGGGDGVGTGGSAMPGLDNGPASGRRQPAGGTDQPVGSSGQPSSDPGQQGGGSGQPGSGPGQPNSVIYQPADAGRSPGIPGGPSSGGPTVIGGIPSGQTAGAPMPANGGRSSDVVIFVDPLTGKPTNAPRPAPSPDGFSAESPPQAERDGNQGARRVRVVPVTSAASGGSSDSGDDQSTAMNRFTPPSFAPPPRRPTALRPVWVHGGRDWTIYVECRAGDVVLYPSQQAFPLAQAVSAAAGNPLTKAIQQMIDRRQSSRRPGEPPYHPQVCLLVRPEHIRTFLTVYPALEALPVPKTRRNLDADDDVISIVTGAVP